jgi:AmmeMemoRadiSam system protein B
MRETFAMNPRLRVAPVPVEVQGQKLLLFQDPERVTEDTILMPLEAAVFVQFMDGTRSVRQIQEEVVRLTGGQIIDARVIEDIVAELDDHLLLFSPRYFAHLERLNREWMQEPVRPAYLAGSGYPADPVQLTAMLDSFYLAPQGPGQLPAPSPLRQDLVGIIAPHVSLEEGGPVMAHAFKVLAEGTVAKLFVIFGTGHNEPERMFVPTDKDFQTPLGLARTDRELVNRISRLRRNRNPLNDYVHKQEHSIEFAVLMLQHALGQRGNDIRILPVLVAGMQHHAGLQISPAEDPSFQDYMGALKLALSERGEPVCFIAAADLAHLGPRYGDRETWAPIRMAEEEANDRRMLDPLLRGDGEGFFQEVARIRDRRRICGFPAIYALMAASGATRAEYLKYGYWHMKEMHSVVSFVSMALF